MGLQQRIAFESIDAATYHNSIIEQCWYLAKYANQSILEVMNMTRSDIRFGVDVVSKFVESEINNSV